MSKVKRPKGNFYIGEAGWFWTYALTEKGILKLKTISRVQFFLVLIVGGILLRMLGFGSLILINWSPLLLEKGKCFA